MDNDISHAVQEQLDALEARIYALEHPEEVTTPDVEDDTPEEAVEY